MQGSRHQACGGLACRLLTNKISCSQMSSPTTSPPNPPTTIAGTPARHNSCGLSVHQGTTRQLKRSEQGDLTVWLTRFRDQDIVYAVHHVIVLVCSGFLFEITFYLLTIHGEDQGHHMAYKLTQSVALLPPPKRRAFAASLYQPGYGV